MTFYIYLHRRLDNSKVFYVGKGTGSRYKRSRSYKSWLTVVDKAGGFTPEIYLNNLSEEDALDIEAELIKNPPVEWELVNISSSNKRLDLVPELFIDQVYYDPSSPSGLRHLHDKGRMRAHSVAGTLRTIKGRDESWSVKVSGRLYTCARVVWVLNNGPIARHFIVDHKDRNVSNNDVANLRLATYKENANNRSISRNNNTGVSGIQFYSYGGYEYYTSSISINGRSGLKYFSILKHGKDLALKLAIDYRTTYNLKGHQYG